MDFPEEIRRNRRKTVIVGLLMLALLFAVLFVMGYILGFPPLLTAPLALVIAVVYLGITSSAGVSTILRATKARPANPQVRQERLLLHRVEEMALAAGLPVPKVYVQDSRDPNAFAAGMTPDKAVICVTKGALEMLDQEELEGVIGHEMSHIANYDVRLATYTVAVVGTIAILAEIAIRALLWGGGSRDGKGALPFILLGIVFLILAPIFSRMTYLAMSRQREYLADATGTKLTRNPDGLARALEKIRDDMPDDPKGSKTAAALYIANPWKRTLRESLWATHPPINERIKRLRGGRPPEPRKEPRVVSPPAFKRAQ